jgi:hypothetical protein
MYSMSINDANCNFKLTESVNFVLQDVLQLMFVPSVAWL